MMWRRLRYERTALQWWPVDRIEADLADSVRWLAPLSVESETRPTLYAHPTANVTYRVPLRPGDRCLAAAALMPDTWNRNLGGVNFGLTVQAPDGRDVAKLHRRIDPGTKPADRRWVEVSLAVGEDAALVTLHTRVPDWYAGENARAVWGSPGVERRRSVRQMARIVRAVVRSGRHTGVRGVLKRNGLLGVRDDLMPEYRLWALSREPVPDDLARMARESATLEYQPRISILTPVYNTRADLLRACVRSVLAQVYPHWEWCLCDDGSTSEATRAVLAAQTDPRIRVVTQAKNTGIAGASQAALALASGEFVALLDHDDELTPDALYRMVCRLNQSRTADVIYSDEDKRDEDGGLSDPFFKPDWSPEYLLSNMYACHLTVIRKTVIESAGGFRPGTDGAQDHDLMLRLGEVTPRIEHLPHVLYHWRRTHGSTALAPGEKQWANDRGRIAVEDHLRRTGGGSRVESGGVPGLYRARFDVRGDPKLLVIVVGADEAARRLCAEQIRGRTTDVKFEVGEAAAEAAAVNGTVAGSDADYVAVIDASLEMLDAGWAHAMLEYAQQPSIGVVGGKISYADGCLRHIGLVVGVGGGVARALHRQLEPHGYFGSAMTVRNYSAVSGECLMTRRALFHELGGLTESLPWSVIDVDYCLRARAKGHRVVFTPYAPSRIRPGGSSSALPDAAALEALRRRWGSVLDDDPYYNPNLDPADAQYRLRSSPI
jgi:GT2 family glycosyltransferase